VRIRGLFVTDEDFWLASPERGQGERPKQVYEPTSNKDFWFQVQAAVSFNVQEDVGILRARNERPTPEFICLRRIYQPKAD